MLRAFCEEQLTSEIRGEAAFLKGTRDGRDFKRRERLCAEWEFPGEV